MAIHRGYLYVHHVRVCVCVTVPSSRIFLDKQNQSEKKNTPQ